MEKDFYLMLVKLVLRVTPLKKDISQMDIQLLYPFFIALFEL